MGKAKLVHNVAINDADYVVSPKVNGKQISCKFYSTWKHMLQRCYCEKYKSNNPSYTDCSVDPEWLTFSNFKRWMEQQDWQGKQLDKDILVAGNKSYSPELCVFVDALTNTFTSDRSADRGDWPIGVYFSKRAGKFKSSCSNPFTKKLEHLGFFETPDEAYQAWKSKKHSISCKIADLQSDERVAIALRSRYL